MYTSLLVQHSDKNRSEGKKIRQKWNPFFNHDHNSKSKGRRNAWSEKEHNYLCNTSWQIKELDSCSAIFVIYRDKCFAVISSALRGSGVDSFLLSSSLSLGSDDQWKGQYWIKVRAGGPCLMCVTTEWLHVSTPDITTVLSVTQMASKTSCFKILKMF